MSDYVFDIHLRSGQVITAECSWGLEEFYTALPGAPGAAVCLYNDEGNVTAVLMMDAVAAIVPHTRLAPAQTPIVPADPNRVRDREGDVWVHTVGDQWVLADGTSLRPYSWEELENSYGPLVPVDSSTSRE